jgi:hypothetical protein
LFTGDFERQVKEASGDGASLSVGALQGEPGRGVPLLGTYKVCNRRLWKWNIFLYSMFKKTNTMHFTFTLICIN